MHNLFVFGFGFVVGGALVGTYHLWKARAWAEALKLTQSAQKRYL